MGLGALGRKHRYHRAHPQSSRPGFHSPHTWSKTLPMRRSQPLSSNCARVHSLECSVDKFPHQGTVVVAVVDAVGLVRVLAPVGAVERGQAQEVARAECGPTDGPADAAGQTRRQSCLHTPTPSHQLRSSHAR